MVGQYPQEMWYCIYYELNQCPISAISPLSVPPPTIQYILHHPSTVGSQRFVPTYLYFTNLY